MRHPKDDDILNSHGGGILDKGPTFFFLVRKTKVQLSHGTVRPYPWKEGER